MRVTVDNTDPAQARADLLAVPLLQADGSEPRLPRRVTALDRALGGRGRRLERARLRLHRDHAAALGDRSPCA